MPCREDLKVTRFRLLVLSFHSIRGLNENDNIFPSDFRREHTFRLALSVRGLLRKVFCSKNSKQTDDIDLQFRVHALIRMPTSVQLHFIYSRLNSRRTGHDVMNVRRYQTGWLAGKLATIIDD